MGQYEKMIKNQLIAVDLEKYNVHVLIQTCSRLCLIHIVV